MSLRKNIYLWLLPVLVMLTACGRSQPQNVILIVVDTLRADHLSIYGYERPTSPHLQSWAESGLVFDSALAPSPWTLPTFGSVLTGLWPAQHAAGARLPQGAKKWRRSPLSPEVTTVPEIMKSNGVSTAAVVNNAFLREHFGAARGFESYDYKKGRQAGKVVDLAVSWLEENDEDRFFLMLHMIDPHLPYTPPSEFLGRFGEVSADDLPAKNRGKIVDRLSDLTQTDREVLVARYDEEIAYVDDELGRLLEWLDERGLFENSLIILTSDHGEEMFDHGGYEHGHSMFQEVLRVPLIFWGAGVAAGREELPVSSVDLAPTIFEAMDVDFEEQLSGVSLWRTITAGDRPTRRDLLAQNTLWGRERQAIVSWPFKLILNPKSGRRQLYDLVADPLERDDLTTENPAIAQELERRLQDRLQGLETSPLAEGVVLTEEVEEELRALGYLD